jgi:hypothetical protein
VGDLGSNERVFAFESRLRTEESLNEQEWAGQLAGGLRVDEVGLGAGYAALRRANSTRLRPSPRTRRRS